MVHYTYFKCTIITLRLKFFFFFLRKCYRNDVRPTPPIYTLSNENIENSKKYILSIMITSLYMCVVVHIIIILYINGIYK